MKHTLLLVSVLLVSFTSFSQKKESKGKLECIAFWNQENLYDTINDPDKNDEDFLPEGTYKWNSERYKKKLENMSNVIAQLGKVETGFSGPSLIGVCEVENKKVLEDLAATKNLKGNSYKVIHFDSPDARGIDVALLYNSKKFKPISSRKYGVKLSSDYKTRDQLLVCGKLNGDMIYIIVCHWPSRRGGEKESEPSRIEAASVSKKIIDSILQVNKEAKIILMGDLNDEPTNESIKSTLKTTSDKSLTNDEMLFNAMESFVADKSKGTIMHDRKWFVFDQMILSQALVKEGGKGFLFNKSVIFNSPQVLEAEGKYKGSPFRTYVGKKYMGGYSDHMAVYIVLKTAK